MTAESDEERALLAAIADEPDDDAPRLVYADWLMQRGDPRGELVVTQCQLARRPGPWERYRLARRERELLAEVPRWPFGESFYRRGVLDMIRVEPEDITSRPGAGLPRAVQLWFPHHEPADDVIAAYRALLAHPAFARVEELDLSMLDGDDRLWHILLDGPGRLQRLVLPHRWGAATQPLDQRGWLTDKDVARLCAAPCLAALRSLDLNGAADNAALTGIAKAPWFPRLEALVLGPPMASGHIVDGPEQGEYGAVDDAGIAGIVNIANTVATRLRRLDLRWHRITADGIAALAASSLELAELWLTVDGLGRDGLAALERSRLAQVARVTIGRFEDVHTTAIAALVGSSTRCDDWLDLYGRYQPTLDSVVAAIAGAEASPVHELRIAHTKVRPPALAALLASPVASQLNHLRISNVELQAAGCRALAAAPLALETLTLDTCYPGATGFAALLAAPPLARLETLHVHRCNLGSKGIRALAKSALRPSELSIIDDADGRSLLALLESPVLSNVRRLHAGIVAPDLDSNAFVKTILATPQLANLQQLSIPAIAQLPPERKATVVERFAAVLPRARGFQVT